MANQEFTTEELATEEWRTIPEFPSYQVSSLGRVLGERGMATPRLTGEGYYRLHLRYKPGRNGEKSRYIHRLVLAAFVGASNQETNHKDARKTNNRLTNLEYCTKEENLAHARNMGLLTKSRGTKARAAKLTESDVRHIRQLASDGVNQVQIGKLFRVTGEAVNKIIRGVNWRWLT